MDRFYVEILVPLEKKGFGEAQDPPYECPEYGLGDYATFLFDPDGLKHLYFITAIALTILALVTVNFVNLTTARASSRLREIGVRKTVGAERRQVAYRFLGEALIQATVGFVIALGVAELTRPEFAMMFARRAMSGLDTGWILVLCAVSVITTGLIAGPYCYPGSIQ